MKLVLSSAILTNMLVSSSSTTWAEGSRRHLNKLLFNKQRRADRHRMLARELLVSSTTSSNKEENSSPKTKQEASRVMWKPLRNTQQVGDRRDENKDTLEADIGLLAYQSPEEFVGAVEVDDNDPAIVHRHLQTSYCENLATTMGAECDCSQVDTAPYEGTARCTYTTEEICVCQDMNPDKKICFTSTTDFVLNGTITADGTSTSTIVSSCITVGTSYLEEGSPPVACITYSEGGYGLVAGERKACDVKLGDTTCNSCSSQAYEYTAAVSYGGYALNVTTIGYCVDFDCSNYLGSKATGTKVGSTCADEFPVATIELYLQNQEDDVCPADDSTPTSAPDDSSTPDDTAPPVGDSSAPPGGGDPAPTEAPATTDNTAPPVVGDSSAPPIGAGGGPAPTEAPTSTDGAIHTTSSVASSLLLAVTGGAMMLLVAVM